MDYIESTISGHLKVLKVISDQSSALAPQLLKELAGEGVTVSSITDVWILTNSVNQHSLKL